MENKKLLKVYVVGSAKYYADFIRDCELVDKLEDAKLVVFTGGEDVTPSLYGCEKHRTTYNNPKRDEAEVKVFKQIRPDQVVLGICRGLTMAHEKRGEFDGNAEMPTRSQAREEILSKVQRLGIETKFLPMRKYVSNIPKSALTINNKSL